MPCIVDVGVVIINSHHHLKGRKG